MGQDGARGDNSLSLKGRDSSPGWEGALVHIIDSWTTIFQFGKWSRLGSSFPVWKVIRDF
jgi:hypothetical protein